jgi:tetratricopeptide (TPR) repeat protein
MSATNHPPCGSEPPRRSGSAGTLDPNHLLDEISNSLVSALKATGTPPDAAKAHVLQLLLAAGTEDDDHLYSDGENENLLPHRQYAAKLARDLFQSSPSDPEVLDCLGMSLIRLADYQDALDCYAKLTEANPEKGIPWNNVAWCQFRLGRLTEAQAAVEKAIRLLPEHAYLWHDRACILMGLGKLDESLSVIRHARAQLSPQTPQLTYLQARVLELAGDRRAAVAAWKEYLAEVTSFPSHFRAFERALKHLEDLHAGRWQWQVRRLRTRMGPPRTLTAMLLDLLGLSVGDQMDLPPSQDESRNAQANQVAIEGWQLFRRRDLGGAESKCRRAMATWPHCALARVLDARLALQRRDNAAYGKYVALANVEQLFPPIAPVRARALAEFVFYLMCVHAEKLYLDAQYDTASKQVAEIERIAPGNPMAADLRRLIAGALSKKYKADTFHERACASSPITAPTAPPLGFSMGRRW